VKPNNYPNVFEELRDQRPRTPRGKGQRFDAKAMEATSWQHDTRVIWPKSARASSTYGGGWSPREVVGPPKVFPRSGDIRGAWAPAEVGKHGGAGLHYLDVSFHGKHQAAEVWVFETNVAGCTYAVTDRTVKSDEKILWERDPEQSLTGAHVLVVTIDPARPISRLRVYVDGRGIMQFPEIDTVGLVRDLPRDTGPRVNWRRSWLASHVSPSVVVAFLVTTLLYLWIAVPRGWIVSRVPGARATSLPLAEGGVKWASRASNSALVGPPDDKSWQAKETIDVASVDIDPARDVRAIYVVESIPGSVVRVDDISSIAPRALWQPTAQDTRSTKDRVLRIDLAGARHISRVRVLVDRGLTPYGGVDAIGTQ